MWYANFADIHSYSQHILKLVSALVAQKPVSDVERQPMSANVFDDDLEALQRILRYSGIEKTKEEVSAFVERAAYSLNYDKPTACRFLQIMHSMGTPEEGQHHLPDAFYDVRNPISMGKPNRNPDIVRLTPEQREQLVEQVRKQLYGFGLIGQPEIVPLSELTSDNHDPCNARIAALEAAIRKHRDTKGDDRCHLDDGELYSILPEGDTRPPKDTAVTIENCQKFIECRQQGREYVSPQRIIDHLETENQKLRKAFDTIREIINQDDK